MEAMMYDYDIPDLSGTWQRDVRNLCASTRRLALKHPGAFSIYETYRHRVAAEHRLHEAFHSTLLAAGFPCRIAVQSIRVLLAYTEAFAVAEISGWLDSDDQSELLDSFGQGPYPTLINLGEEIACSDPNDDFEFGLNVLIRGLETHSS
jgi:TetR/AcrR family tetracycline transcriptional repressor